MAQDLLDECGGVRCTDFYAAYNGVLGHKRSQAALLGASGARPGGPGAGPEPERGPALGRARCSADTADHPCQTLAQRLRRPQGELFAFVRVPEVAPTTKEAERALRPLVIARMISAGTRSPRGTQTRLALASRFQSWQARGLTPFVAWACYSLLFPAPLCFTPRLSSYLKT